LRVGVLTEGQSYLLLALEGKIVVIVQATSVVFGMVEK
jgi:hypothetical protein